MRWVSIKILTADATTHSHELGILRSLAKFCKGALSSRYLVRLLDGFSHQGPNGNHQCLVFELLGPTVDMVVSDYSNYDDREEWLDPDIVLRISEQLLNAVTFIHEAGYAHEGTMSPEMVVAPATPNLFLFSTADFQQILAVETLSLHVIICLRHPRKTSSISLDHQNQRI